MNDLNKLHQEWFLTVGDAMAALAPYLFANHNNENDTKLKYKFKYICLLISM